MYSRRSACEPLTARSIISFPIKRSSARRTSASASFCLRSGALAEDNPNIPGFTPTSYLGTRPPARSMTRSLASSATSSRIRARQPGGHRGDSGHPGRQLTTSPGLRRRLRHGRRLADLLDSRTSRPTADSPPRSTPGSRCSASSSITASISSTRAATAPSASSSPSTIRSTSVARTTSQAPPTTSAPT